MSQTTVAVVGTGFIGPVHVEALRRLGVHVKGILGSSAEKSLNAAKDLGLEVGYSSYEALLTAQQVSWITISYWQKTCLFSKRKSIKSRRNYCLKFVEY